MLIDANHISFISVPACVCMYDRNIHLFGMLNMKNVRSFFVRFCFWLCIQTFGGAFCGGQPTNISVDIFCKIGEKK